MHIKLTNGVPTPYSIGQLRRDNPNTSFPKHIPNRILETYNVFPYTQEQQPTFDEKTQKLEDGEFVEQDGDWVKTWTVAEKTQEEIDAWVEAKAESIRSQRNQLLAETDYLALSDNTLTLEMAAYRQALRDITNQVDFPENVTWPTKPE